MTRSRESYLILAALALGLWVVLSLLAWALDDHLALFLLVLGPTLVVTGALILGAEGRL